MHRARRILISAAACAVPLLALATGSAHADTITTIPQLSGFHQMVVDTTSHAGAGYVFMSGDTSIVVTDLSGKYVTAIDAGDGVEGIALSPDGGTLYAALTKGSDADSIAAIPVSTITTTEPAKQTTYRLGSGDVPYAVAVQSSKIWVSYRKPGASGTTGTIGAIRLPAGKFQTQAATDTWASPPDLAADPSDTGVLVAVLPGTSPALAAVFNTTATQATVKVARGQLGGTGKSECVSEHQVAVVPGGAQFIVACAQPQGEGAYSTSTAGSLSSPARIYGSGKSAPAGVAVDADGTVAVGTHGSPSAIYVYGPGPTGALLNIFKLTAPNSLAAMQGLAWEDTASGPRLAAMLQRSTSPAYSLDVFDRPTVTRSVLTLTAPSTAVIGAKVALTGSLTLSNGDPLPSGAVVNVVRNGPGSTEKFQPALSANGGFTLQDTPAEVGKYTYTASYAGDGTIATSATATVNVTVVRQSSRLRVSGPSSADVGNGVTLSGVLAFGSGTVPAGTALTVTRSVAGIVDHKAYTVSTVQGGAFKVTDKPNVAGTYTYTARYAGTATIAPATARFKVSVVRAATSLTVTTNGTAFTYEPTVRVTAHLGTTYRNRTVSIYAQWFGSKGKSLLKTGTVNSSGDLTVTYRAPHSTRFTVVFRGDARYAPATVTRSVTVAAEVSESITGYYGSKDVGGVVYRLFHSNDLISDTVGVLPLKHGECVKFEVQEYIQGAWDPLQVTSCVSLNSSSQAAEDFALNKADLRFQYRVRADYIPSASDPTNESGDSPWRYFIVEP